MIITTNEQKLYLTNWEYNACRIINKIAEILKTNISGAVRVKEYNKTAYITSRIPFEAVAKYENDIETYKKIITTTMDPERKNKLSKLLEKTEQRKTAAEEEIKTLEFLPVKHGTFLTFSINENYYYLELPDNPFFEVHYQKTAIINGKRSRDAYLEELEKDWLTDNILAKVATNDEIEKAAVKILETLVNAKLSGKYRDGRKQRVPNVYNNGYHYETIYRPERFEQIDF